MAARGGIPSVFSAAISALPRSYPVHPAFTKLCLYPNGPSIDPGVCVRFGTDLIGDPVAYRIYQSSSAVLQ